MGCGAVFELSPPTTPGGVWSQTEFYDFKASQTDGLAYVNGLVFDKADALYGTTLNGGSGEGGTVFKIVRHNGVWTERTIDNFSRADGLFASFGGVIVDDAGNVFATASFGGDTACQYGCGGILETVPLPTVPGGPYTETTLFSFTGGLNGGLSLGYLLRDKAGNLYGTASTAGLLNNGTRGGNGRQTVSDSARPR